MSIIHRRVGAGSKLAQHGWSMIELLVSITIGAFVIAGLFSLLYNLTLASSSQTGMSGLEDNERVAMLALQNGVEDAGYAPEIYFFAAGTAVQLNLSAGFPANSGTASGIVSGVSNAGQFIYGLSGGGSNSDTIYVRYLSGAAAGGADGVTDCVGRNFSTTASSGYTYASVFSVDANGNLDCTAYDGSGGAGVTYQIASGLSTTAGTPGMSINYGIDPAGTGTVTEYLPASAMGTYWFNSASTIYSHCAVRSVQFTLNFNNPMYNSTISADNAGQPQFRTVVLTVFLINNPTTTQTQL